MEGKNKNTGLTVVLVVLAAAAAMSAYHHYIVMPRAKKKGNLPDNKTDKKDDKVSDKSEAKGGAGASEGGSTGGGGGGTGGGGSFGGGGQNVGETKLLAVEPIQQPTIMISPPVVQKVQQQVSVSQPPKLMANVGKGGGAVKRFSSDGVTYEVLEPVSREFGVNIW